VLCLRKGTIQSIVSGLSLELCIEPPLVITLGCNEAVLFVVPGPLDPGRRYSSSNVVKRTLSSLIVQRESPIPQHGPNASPAESLLTAVCVFVRRKPVWSFVLVLIAVLVLSVFFCAFRSSSSSVVLRACRSSSNSVVFRAQTPPGISTPRRRPTWVPGPLDLDRRLRRAPRSTKTLPCPTS